MLIFGVLKAEKVLAPKQFWREKNFLQNFIFYHPYEYKHFQPAGLLKIALIVTPLLLIVTSSPYYNSKYTRK